MPNTVILPTYACNLYLSGPIEVAKQIIRKECYEIGLCVTITPTTYIYTGGEEIGYVVGLINYPRFPSTPDKIWEIAERLAVSLVDNTYQQSVLISDNINTKWVTKRD